MLTDNKGLSADEGTLVKKKWWQEIAALTPTGRLYIVYTAGIGSSFSALFQLADKYGGWPGPVGIALPIVVDFYWITALGTALDSSRTNTQRWLAAVHAVLAISLSITGNIMYELLHRGIWRISDHDLGILVSIIACVPILLTGTLTHLIRLILAPGNRGQGAEPVAGTKAPAPVPAVPASLVPAAGPVPASVRPVLSHPAPALGPVPGTTEPATASGSEPAPVVSEPAAGTGGTPEPVSGPAGSRPGSGTPKGSGSGRHERAAAPRPPADDEALRDLRLKTMADLKAAHAQKEPVESTRTRAVRARTILREFRRITGVDMNAKEFTVAVGVAKGENGNLRALVQELDQEERQQATRGEETA